MKNLTVDSPVIQKDGTILPLSDSAESVGGVEFRVHEFKPQVRVKGIGEWRDFNNSVDLIPEVNAGTVSRGDNDILIQSSDLALGAIVVIMTNGAEPASTRRSTWYVDYTLKSATKLDGGGTLGAATVEYGKIVSSTSTTQTYLNIILVKRRF